MAAIAIFEHDALMRALMTEWLTAEGYAVTGASGDEAPAPSSVGAVVVDVFMPRQRGADQVRAARAAYPGVPIVAISGQFRPGVRCEGSTAGALGADRVVAKPFDRQTLLHAVCSLIGPPVVAAT